ncbi:SRPBCC family protein [Tamlana sp. 2201CG12-4]|uniref:SRPBCC family protein n=1 Tax=Tamlana sp. 2201CG12-4 TaxID=3112582 RepID=UPI002DB9D569|nr:SRPBCC family protein [Tamlana sp. 2201CG12-4]MEC3908397.1 SRPBCC family protein [Tamlana sp. 2201CG12-4]
MIFLYIVLILIGLFIILLLVAPRKYDVNRSVLIDKPLPEVFQYIKLIKNQNEWSPWKKKDPQMKQEYQGTDGEVGFLSKWEGNKDVGTGEQELTRIVENEIIESQLRFFKPWKSQSEAYLKVEEADLGKTKVIWGFSGESKPPTNVFFLFFNMDKTVGKDFEEGLSSLKTILEN